MRYEVSHKFSLLKVFWIGLEEVETVWGLLLPLQIYFVLDFESSTQRKKYEFLQWKLMRCNSSNYRLPILVPFFKHARYTFFNELYKIIINGGHSFGREALEIDCQLDFRFLRSERTSFTFEKHRALLLMPSGRQWLEYMNLEENFVVDFIYHVYVYCVIVRFEREKVKPIAFHFTLTSWPLKK